MSNTSTSPSVKPQASRLVAVLVLAAIVALAAATPFLPNYHIRVVNSLLIYILLGIGLNIVIGYTGLLDLGFVAFYAVGAYTYALLASPQLDLHLPFLLIVGIAAVLGMITGILLGIPVLKLRGDYLAIVTLGFGEIIRIVINNVDWLTGGPKGIARLDKASILGVEIARPVEIYWLLLVTVFLVGLFVWRLERSILGKAWAAIREDQDAARGIGINTTNAKLAAFATSATIGAIAGTIFAASQRFVSPESFTLQESVLIVLMIVIGGIGNILGIVAGAAILILLPEVLREFAEWRILFLGILMVVLIIVRPAGIVPRTFGPEKLIRGLFGK
ncbi:branched-chain amino acid ABC transporter permease [Shinella sumterensis]|jgi:branched-chain amino acid transport system permease protein|uniref:branched-chain amino acid ABC transporter permease n=1 Tax=Shinella sumterensis TaxID=1967501 RepID=UPI001102A411|nr:branched-chain amino acid ABC transporter permease [Shinella sumterensis]MDP9587910.1 branched-chain amino acid transport system permease protein [Shinella zoogloeoides]TFE99858.1 branched-chain amino acid ABC transporter permease [Shinella sumterensis]